MDVGTNIEWNDRLEELMGEEGERSLCFSWLHNKAEALYSFRNSAIAIPVVILSTLAGTASIGSSSLFGDAQYAQVGIGLVSITVGILNSISQFFAWAKRAEGHRRSHIQHHKLFRYIATQMSLPRKERIKAAELLRAVTEEVDRLSETSPSVPAVVLNEFARKFRNKYKDVARPEITNGLEKIFVYQESVDGTGSVRAKLKTQRISLDSDSAHTPNTVSVRTAEAVLRSASAGSSPTNSEIGSRVSEFTSPSSPFNIDNPMRVARVVEGSLSGLSGAAVAGTSALPVGPTGTGSAKAEKLSPPAPNTPGGTGIVTDVV